MNKLLSSLKNELVLEDEYYTRLEEANSILLPLVETQFEELISNIINVKSIITGMDHQAIIHNIELRCNALSHAGKLVNEDKG